MVTALQVTTISPTGSGLPCTAIIFGEFYVYQSYYSDYSQVIKKPFILKGAKVYIVRGIHFSRSRSAYVLALHCLQFSLRESKEEKLKTLHFV